MTHKEGIAALERYILKFSSGGNMGDRLRGLGPAYRAGRLDEYLKLRFGSFNEYVRYCLRRELHRIWRFQERLSKLQVPPSSK